MSGPLSMNEIEDVVSSVRKLVSPESSPRPLSRDPGLEKLILTPALRVVPEQKPDSNPKTNAAAPVVEAEWEAPFWTEPEPVLAEMALLAEEAVVVTGPEPVTAVLPVPLAQKPDAARKSPAKQAASAVPLSAAPAAKGAKPTPVATMPTLELVRSEPEEPEAALPVLTPDPVVVDLAATPLILGADVQVKIGTLAESAAPSGIDEELVVNGVVQLLTNRESNPVNLLDEAELVLIVRRVIREELQDVLGERITRNVRKLVRAEINRALTLQTLE